MRISKYKLRQLIREEKEKLQQEVDYSGEGGDGPSVSDHGWPRVDWRDAEDLVDKWRDMEVAAFDPGDPSMNQDGELSTADAKEWWNDQVEGAAMDMENELVERLRKVALQTMKEYTDKLINGEFA